MQNRIRNVVGIASAGLFCAVVALATLAPSSAKAYWVGGWGWRPGVVVVAPPVIYAPPPVYYAAPRPARWVPGHYDWRGVWIRPHWA